MIMQRRAHLLKIGDKEKCIGPDLVAYETGKYCLVTCNHEEIDMCSDMPELDEAHLLCIDVLNQNDVISE